MTMERQTSWGGGIALYMFLSGTGAGIYAVSFILGLIHGMGWLMFTGLVLGPALVVLGMVPLLLHAGSPFRSYRLLYGVSTSWIARGGLMQLLFIILGLAYALPGLWLTEWLGSGAGMIIGVIAFVLALAIAVYHGMALTESRAIPLWSSSVQPVLFFFAALCSGLGLLVLISPAYGSAGMMGVVGITALAGIAVILGELISIWSLIGSRSTAVYMESVRRVRAPMMVSVIFLLLALLLFVLVMARVSYSVWAFPIAGALLLVGGLVTRYSILRGGYYIPLRVPVSSSP